MEREFNLIDEPWICVRKSDCDIREVSLKDALLNAHNYSELAGETRSQDFAMLRFLLAIIHTAFSRRDCSNEEADTDNFDYAADNWAAIWENGMLPQEPVENYLNEWHDRFWLFDEKYPFYQSNAVNGKGNPYNTSKIIGTLFESNNKPRLFADRTDDGRLLSYSEAARWLLHINCFDDIAAKKPTPKKTYTGTLGLIAIKGKNLFETLMLNYVANADNLREVRETPSWELEQNDNLNNVVAVPDNQALLLSIMSRRIYLCRENKSIKEYYLSGGDYFEQVDIATEQMTLWIIKDNKKDKDIVIKPMRHSPSKAAWQEFGEIAAFTDVNSIKDNENNGKRTPGVIKWVNYLKEKDLLENNYRIKIETAAVIFDLGQSTSTPVIDTISDSLAFHSVLIDEHKPQFRNLVNDEIEKCNNSAKEIWKLSVNLQKSAGASGDDLKGDNEKTQFYSYIDKPFRMWLEGLDPNMDIDDCRREANELFYKSAKKFGERLAAGYNDNAVFGRVVGNNDDKKNKFHSSAKSINMYIGALKKIYNIKAGVILK